jgi:uncharacterized membrane protein YphA (DoxX/SURF4 family)
MSNWTRLFLVVLRVAIGWHFLFEGLEKLDSHLHGPREGKARWTSEFYLRGSTGPLRESFRGQVEDLDKFALDRLTVEPPVAGKEPRLPAALEKDWTDYFERFKSYYDLGSEKTVQPEFIQVLTFAPQSGFPANLPWYALRQSHRTDKPEKQQLVLTQDDFDFAKFATLRWLLHGEREVERSFSKVVERVKETTPDRIKNYRDKLRQIREIEDVGMPAFGKDVWKRNLEKLREEAEILRAELLIEANRPVRAALKLAQDARLGKTQRQKGTVPEPQDERWVSWVNTITMWGLTAVGVCLLLGLFTRTACLGGAAFLLLFYLAMPPFPWLPINPRAEGHYLFINKNIIEMLALLALATTPSGRWLGLDGLIQLLGPWRKRLEPK